MITPVKHMLISAGLRGTPKCDNIFSKLIKKTVENLLTKKPKMSINLHQCYAVDSMLPVKNVPMIFSDFPINIFVYSVFFYRFVCSYGFLKKKNRKK